MINELDTFISFLYDNIDDDRIRVSKNIKYGFRHYQIEFEIDPDPRQNEMFRQATIINFDNRNQCIEIINHSEEINLVIEDIDTLNKWCPILDEFLNKNIGDKISNAMEKTLHGCHRKDLYRLYKINSIDKPNDEN